VPDPDRLYHFTSTYHLPRIMQAGYLKLVESNASPFEAHAAPDVVWLTDLPNPLAHRGWATGSAVDKTAVRIAIPRALVADAQPWLDWLASIDQTPPDFWIAAMAKSGGGTDNVDHWLVHTQPIPTAHFESVDLLVG